MSTTAEYHLHVTLVLLFAWAGTATAEPRKFALNQPEARNLGVWRLTHDPVIRDEGNYHNIQCWSPSGRYTCYTHWGSDNSPGGKSSAEIHVVDLKTGEDRLVDKGANPRWANQHNWLFYCHYTGDGRPPYETGTQVIRYDADTGEKVAIAHGIECPGGTDSTDTWLYGTQRFRGRKPEFVTVRVRNQPGSSLEAVPGVPNRHSYVHVNPRHPVVMMRAKHPEDGPLGTNRVLFDLDGGNVRQGAVMLEEGHVCWRGDGEYLLIGNRQLCGRRWDRPFPSDLETMACGGGGDVCPADRAGRYVVMGNLGIADTRSGDTWHVLTPHSSIIYPLQGDNSTLAYDVARVRADFPILTQEVFGHPLVYLDSAASAQKPRQVIEAMDDAYTTHYSNVHRGVHRMSQLCTDAFEAGREKVARYINAGSSDEIVFTRNATEALNLVADCFGRAFMKAGDEVVISTLEHHSNIVPWQLLRTRFGIELKIAPIDDDGNFLLDEFEALLGPKTRLVAMTHVSNAIGTIVPIKEVIARAHARDIPVLVDGSQSAQHMTVACQDLDADFYAFTKSLETYERTMDASTLFILGTDNEFLRFLDGPR